MPVACCVVVVNLASDVIMQACSTCGVGQRKESECTPESDTQCVDCASGLKPINSVWTTTGNCAWRCETGFTLDISNGNQSQCVKPRQAAPPPALPAEAVVPVVTLQIQLPMTKSDFLAQQDSFIDALARTAGVNPSDVRVVSLTEVSVRRQQAALDVVTQVRTQEADIVEKTLTLDTVNRVLAEAALPPASALRVEVDRTGTPAAPAGEPPPELPTAEPHAVDLPLVVASVGAGFGVLIISATILMWYRRSGRLLWRSDRRICTCHRQDCNVHKCRPLPVVIKGDVQEFRVPMQTQERAPVQTAVESHPQPKNLMHGQEHSSSRRPVADEADAIFVDIPLEPAARHAAPLQSSRADHGSSKSIAAGELSFVTAHVQRPKGEVYGSAPRATGYTPGGSSGKASTPFRNPAILSTARHDEASPAHSLTHSNAHSLTHSISTARHGQFYPPKMPASESTSSQLLGGKSLASFS